MTATMPAGGSAGTTDGRQTQSMKIVQCWDDGVLDDIRLIEILRHHDAKASFNLEDHHGRRLG